jgi:toxin ParE1/3/4
MIGRYVLSPRAQADLDEIWDYPERRWGGSQATAYVRQLQQDIEKVAEQPGLGRACPEIRAGYFRYASGSHVLFYRLKAHRINVVRILHERMDFTRHL